MSAPPDRAETHSEIHQLMRCRTEELIRLNDASEDATTDEERERADTELYDFALALLADVAGPAIGRVLERERDCPLPNGKEPAIKGSWFLPEKEPNRTEVNRVGVNMALAKLLTDLAPGLGTFPARALATDFWGAVLYNSSPLTHVKPKLGRGEKDHAGLRQAARRRIVLAVIFRAAQAELPIPTVWKSFHRGDLKDWKKMRQSVPRGLREKVRVAAKAEREAAHSGRRYEPKDPYVICAKQDSQNPEYVWRLIDRWIPGSRKPPRKRARKSRF